MPSLTIDFDPRIGPVATVAVAKSGTIQTSGHSASGAWKFYSALVDTGAAITCISERIAKDVNLDLIGKRPMASASGEFPANTYLADVCVPLNTRGLLYPGLMCEAAVVLEVREDQYYQALLGRDVLEGVEFVLSGPEKRFTIRAENS